MKKRITILSFVMCIVCTSTIIAQDAYTGLLNGGYQITNLDAVPLYLTAEEATTSGVLTTFSELISPVDSSQIFTFTIGTSGNSLNKYRIRAGKKLVSMNAAGLIKLNASGGVPAFDGKFHAHTLYKSGDRYAIKGAANVVDATTTYIGKFWLYDGTNVTVSSEAATASVPVESDYIFKLIPYAPTKINAVTIMKRICNIIPTGIEVLNQKGTLSIYNTTGQKVKCVSVNGNKMINLSKGFYIIRLRDGNDNFLQKIIVK